MARFSYQAIDGQGAESRGLVEAPSVADAARQLRGRGLWPTAIRAGETRRRARGGRDWVGVLDRVAPRDVAVFARQLATLLQAGMPLVRALEVLARHEPRGPVRQMIERLAGCVRSGGRLSEAMAAQPRAFPPMFVGMVRAGEAGGALPAVFARLARFSEKRLELRGRVKAAMIYPAVVLAVAGSVLAGLLVFVVPRFQQIFADLLKGAPLPTLTQAVLDVSQLVRAHWIIILAVGAASWLALVLVRRTKFGQRAGDALALWIPGLGPFAQKATVARFARTFGTLLETGVPILDALALARETCGNAHLAAALEAVQTRVQAGEPVARPLEEIRAIPPMVVSLVDVGEQSGQLPAMLGRIADIYEAEVDQAVAGLGALLEPFLILFLAVVVGTIVVALFLPMVRIVQLLS